LGSCLIPVAKKVVKSMLRSMDSSIGKTVALVGGGIVNLITAYYLVKNGFSVRIFDQGPDPTTGPDPRLLGCSAGGGDGRVFSLNEARHHFINSPHYDGKVASPFKRTIGEDGYLAIPPSSLTDRDLKWNQRFEAVTKDLAARFNQDLIAFNRESEPMWWEMIAAHPELYQRSGFQPDLFRIYATEEKFTRALSAEKAIGSIRRILELKDVASELPALRDALAAHAIAGVLEVTGFSVNVHRLVNQLIEYLSAQGAEFNWQCKIAGVDRDANGLVKGLKVGAQMIEACHYVMSLGAYSPELLAGFLSADAVAPVVGLWLTISNDSPQLNNPLKIARAGFASKGAAEGANVIPGLDHDGRPVLHVSSGHGYIGFEHESRRYQDVMGLGRAVEETARNMFPKARLIYGERNGEMKACVRPWTATGLGIFESAPTNRDGSFIITGGHNTGGFAQAPAVAMAVLAALEHRRHPMHSLYHPNRPLR
jgi:glycine/D-amino acid oxidase-like deaminating enzyme